MLVVSASFNLVCDFIDNLLKEYKISITVIPDVLMHGRSTTIEYCKDTKIYLLGFSEKLSLKVYSEFILHNVAHVVDWEKNGKPTVENNHRDSWEREFKLLKIKYYKYTHVAENYINGEII